MLKFAWDFKNLMRAVTLSTTDVETHGEEKKSFNSLSDNIRRFFGPFVRSRLKYKSTYVRSSKM